MIGILYIVGGATHAPPISAFEWHPYVIDASDLRELGDDARMMQHEETVYTEEVSGNGTRITNVVEYYDEEDDAWKEAPSLPLKLYRPVAFSFDEDGENGG